MHFFVLKPRLFSETLCIFVSAEFVYSPTNNRCQGETAIRPYVSWLSSLLYDLNLLLPHLDLSRLHHYPHPPTLIHLVVYV
jgi:hypothetical protein